MRSSASISQLAFRAMAILAMWLAFDARAGAGVSPVAMVGMKVVRGETIEPSPLSRVAPAEVVVYRDGPVEGELTVALTVEGSATPGVDYDAVEPVVKFAAGAAEVRVMVGAYDDSLIEGDESVALILTPPAGDAIPKYAIDPAASAVKLIIHDNDFEPRASIKITSPSSGVDLPRGADVSVSAVAVDPQGYIATLEFFLDGNLLDRSVITFIRAPDPGTPIDHQVLWKSPLPGKHELWARGIDARGVTVLSESVVVVVVENQADTLVSIVATDAEGTELPPFFNSIDELSFEISRTGSTAGSLVVFFSLHGTASSEDYFEVPTSVIIPSGSASAKLRVVPKSDLLDVVEPMETVGVRLEPSPMAGPLRTYGIDGGRATAAGVIYERKPPEGPAVELVFPVRGEGYESGQPIEIVAATYMGDEWLVVEFYDGEKKIGSGAGTIDTVLAKTPALMFQSFTWKGAAIGEHVLTARMTKADGKQVVSERCLVVVKGGGGSQAYIKVAEPADGQAFRAGESIGITAVAVDPEGYIPRVEFFANEKRIGVSELAFFRAPDPGTPITHTFVWENAAVGSYELSVRGADAHGQTVFSFPIKIVVGLDGGGDRVVLTVEAIDAVAAEMGAGEVPDSAVFVIRRVAGPKDVDVPVTFALFGTALNGVDYKEVSEKTILRAGVNQVEVVIEPIPDKAIEGDEVIGLALKEPACVKIFPPPPECYLIGNPGGARAVLHDNGGPTASARVEILAPKSGESFEAGADIEVTAVAVDPKGYIPRLEFYANERLIGVSEIVFIRAPDPGTPITHTTLWAQVPAGDYVLTARGIDAQGQTVAALPVKIQVGGGGGGGGSEQVVVMVEAIDALASETTETGAPDNGVFLIRRIAGRKDVEVPVFFKLGGSAIKGVDYEELKDLAVIPAGSESVEVVIKPIPDKAIEADETVELILTEPICPAIFPPPPNCYLIGKSGAARVIIRDQSTGGEEWKPKMAIIPPRDGSKLASGQPLEIQTDAAVKGKGCILETSLDLKTWTPVAPVFLPDGQLTYVTETGTESQRYYRLRVQ